MTLGKTLVSEAIGSSNGPGIHARTTIAYKQGFEVYLRRCD